MYGKAYKGSLVASITILGLALTLITWYRGDFLARRWRDTAIPSASDVARGIGGRGI
jgi:hypothetical protein